MILTHLDRLASTPGRVYGPGSARPWGEIRAAVARWRAEAGAAFERPVGLAASSPAGTLALLAAAEAVGADATLLPVTRPGALGLARSGVCNSVTADDEFRLLIQSVGGRQVPGEPSLRLFSSGTTGTPHPRLWTWPELWRSVHVPPRVVGGLWVSAHPPDTFGGVQAALHALAGCESLAFVPAGGEPGEALGQGADVRLWMATPTFARRVLLGEWGWSRPGLRVENLTLGGEAADQSLLDRLVARFPRCRIVHVYASTDTGSVFSVADGRAGFPAAWLEPGSGRGLEVRDGQLFVSRPAVPPAPTGDLVRLEGDRVLFDGRLGEVINAGGVKVSAARVGALLREVPGVRDARAYAAPSRVTGEVVAADVVADAGVDPDILADRICAHFRAVAPDERPRKLRFVPDLPPTAAGKAGRG